MQILASKVEAVRKVYQVLRQVINTGEGSHQLVPATVKIHEWPGTNQLDLAIHHLILKRGPIYKGPA